jgi:hypothetical protein
MNLFVSLINKYLFIGIKFLYYIILILFKYKIKII